MDKIIFQNTDDFTALYKDGKYAIYSNKEQKFVTDYLFEKISYVPARNYFVVRKDGKNMVIDTQGNKINFPSYYPKSFLREALIHHRFKDDIYAIWQNGEIIVIDTTGKKVDTMFFKKETTGLSMNVTLLSPNLGQGEKHIPYVLIQNDYDETQNLNYIKVKLDGTILGNKKPVFDEESELFDLREWLEINKLPILMYWTKTECDITQVKNIVRTLNIIHPKYHFDSKTDWESTRIIHAKDLEEYFDSIWDKIIGKTINRIFYTNNLYNYYWDMTDYEYKNGEWLNDGKKANPPAYYQWKDRDVSLQLDSPVILDFEGERLEIEYWTGSLVNVNMNSINIEDFGADVSKHFAVNIIGQKLVDIKIHKTDKVYFMNFSHLGVDRKDGDDMFEQIWFIFENGFKLELTTDYCDYTEFSELPRYVRVG